MAALTANSTSTRRAPMQYLAAQALMAGFAATVLFTVSNARFLIDYGSEALPYAYVAIAIVTPLISLGFAKLQQRWPLPKLLPATIGVFAALFLIGWVLLTLTTSREMSFVLLVADQVIFGFMIMVINLQATRLFNLQEMKTQMPLVIASMTISAIAGGLLVPLLTRFLPDVSYLLLLGMLVLLLMIGLSITTTRAFAEQFAQTKAEQKAEGKSIRQLLAKQFIRRIFIYQLFSALGTYLVVFLFAVAADRAFDSAEALANFFGSYIAGMTFAILLFLIFGSGRLLKRFGLSFGLMANPIAVLVMVTIMLVFDLGGGTIGLLFGIVIVARVFDAVFSAGTTDPSIKAMYQALPDKERTSVLTAVEGIAVPAARGITGVLLIVFATVPSLNDTHILMLTLVACLIWVATGWLVYSDYAGALVKTLNKRALSEADMTLDDESTLTVVQRMLGSADIQQVRLGLDMLVRANHPTLPTRLIGLLETDSTDIRTEALNRIEQQHLTAALPSVRALLANEPDSNVRGAALRAISALDEEHAIETVTPYLDDGLSETSIGALVGLLRYGGIPGVLLAGNQLQDLEESDSVNERLIVARVIGEVGVDNFYQPLLNLLQDNDLTVRRAALDAAASVHHPRLLPYVIDNLSNPLSRSAAMSALQATGDRLLPTVATALAGESEHDEEDVIRMVRVCGQIKGERALDTLKPHVNHPDDNVQFAVLSALNLCDYRATDSAEIDHINMTLRGEIEHALRTLVVEQVLGDDESFATIQRSLNYEFDLARKRVFLLLSFLYDAQAILRAQERLILGSSAEQAVAFETLDVLLTNEQKGMVLPLVDGSLSAEQRITQLSKLFKLPQRNVVDWLRDIIADPDAIWTHGWTRASAIHAAAILHLTELLPEVHAASSVKEHPIPETAMWALNQL